LTTKTPADSSVPARDAGKSSRASDPISMLEAESETSDLETTRPKAGGKGGSFATNSRDAQFIPGTNSAMAGFTNSMSSSTPPAVEDDIMAFDDFENSFDE